ncbi:unnamed protein product [Protopolystoma xenopodis]|uniref:Nudix hydrolase domain-containing protein n=1 Tax=Protopolystoma xenopodis TaxID=117903 RepID=A0A3S5AY67_9PLAT|nr:unnamed protein product [Protopolystoma xenopodis]
MANESDSLPASQALRICAVRELFEETGILLACDKSDESKPPHLLACLLSHSDCKAWRKRVQEKAGSLALLYGELGLKLPLSALEEWSNWLTPAHNKKRFDTIFYYAGISGLKYLNGGSSSVISEPSEEVHSLYLDSPAAFLSHNPNDEGPVFMSTTKSPLMPPQAYELCRVIRFPHVAQLTRFARQRASFGCRRWNCVLAYAKCNKTNDSLVPMYLLPGDKRYKDAHEFSEEHGETITLTGDWQSDSHLNRLLIMRKQYPGLWWKSNIFDLGHVLPVTLEEFTMNYAQN